MTLKAPVFEKIVINDCQRIFYRGMYSPIKKLVAYYDFEILPEAGNVAEHPLSDAFAQASFISEAVSLPK
jgi:hypothetical protein